MKVMKIAIVIIFLTLLSTFLIACGDQNNNRVSSIHYQSLQDEIWRLRRENQDLLNENRTLQSELSLAQSQLEAQHLAQLEAQYPAVEVTELEGTWDYSSNRTEVSRRLGTAIYTITFTGNTFTIYEVIEDHGHRFSSRLYISGVAQAIPTVGSGMDSINALPIGAELIGVEHGRNNWKASISGTFSVIGSYVEFVQANGSFLVLEFRRTPNTLTFTSPHGFHGRQVTADFILR